MGTASSFQCCDNKHADEGEYRTKMKEQLEDERNNEHYQDYLQLKQHLDKVNLLTTLEYQIEEITHGQEHLRNIARCFDNIDHFMELVDLEEKEVSVSVLESKTYNCSQMRYDKVNNRNKTYQIALIDVYSLSKEQNGVSDISEGIASVKRSLKVLQLLKLEEDEQFDPSNQQKYIKEMYQMLRSIPQIRDRVWDIRQKNNYDQMASHMHYNLTRYIHFINSYLSLNDTVSYSQIKLLYHFIEHFFCKREHQNLEESYFCKIQGNQSEVELYRKGNPLFLSNFMEFVPLQEQIDMQGSEIGQSRSIYNERQISKIQVYFILKPNSKNTIPYKFRHDESLFYLPFTLFVITKMKRKSGKLLIYLDQLKEQYLIEEINSVKSKNNQESVNHVSINEQNLLNELKAMRDTVKQQLEGTLVSHHEKIDMDIKSQTTFIPFQKKINELPKKYVREYLVQDRQRIQINKIRPNGRQSNIVHVMEEQINLQVREKPIVRQEEEYEKDITFQLIELRQGQITQCEKMLSKYINNLEFVKLENQLYNIDKFYYLTSLNLSQSWLQKIECLQCFPNLTELYLYSNEITKIQGLEYTPNLKVLSLSRNQIELLQNLDHLIYLRSLFVTKNKLKIQSAEYLNKLKLDKLQVLTISFVYNPNQCIETLLKNIPKRLKRLAINDGDLLSNRTKNMLAKKLRKIEVQIFHG